MSPHFLYTSILERRPGLGFSDQVRIIPCIDCGAEVKTLARNCKRCRACAEKRKRAVVAARDERRRAAR
jgi:hypothetical protein